MNPALRGAIKGRPLRMIIKMGLAVLTIPVGIKNGDIRIEQIPTMSPKPHSKSNFLTKEIEMRIIRDLLNDRRRSKQEASAAEHPWDRFCGSVIDLDCTALHGENAVVVELLGAHGKNVPFVQAVGGGIAG